MYIYILGFSICIWHMVYVYIYIITMVYDLSNLGTIYRPPAPHSMDDRRWGLGGELPDLFYWSVRRSK